MEEVAISNVLLDLGFGLVHPNHERNLAETDRASVELRGEKQGSGGYQVSIMSGALHTLWFYQDQ